MSWSVSLSKPVERELADSAIDAMAPPQTTDVSPPLEHHAALAQLAQAKEAAKALLKIIPGRYVMVTLAGHANATGWYKKEGYANDCINVNVSQVTEADLQFYK